MSDPLDPKRMVEQGEAGFEFVETAIEAQIEGNHEVPYLWMFAHKRR